MSDDTTSGNGTGSGQGGKKRGRYKRRPYGPRSVDNVIDWDELEKLCDLGATADECASFFKCTGDQLRRAVKRYFGMTFTDYHTERRKAGHARLRRAQWTAAVEDKNPTMLIWLGKNYLGQSDLPGVGAPTTDDGDAALDTLLGRIAKVRAARTGLAPESDLPTGSSAGLPS